MKILVTGVLGFIGSAFTKYVLENYSDVNIVGVGRFSSQKNLKRLENAWQDKRFTMYYADFARDQLSDAFQDVEYVIHFGAKSITGETYVPVRSPIGTRMITFEEFWKQQRINKPTEQEGNQIIRLRGNQVKVLSFYSGGQWMPVKAIMRHKYDGKVIKLCQKVGAIEATPSHSIYSATLELAKPTDNPDMLAIRSVNEYGRQYKAASKKLLEILAAYITEGCASYDKANGTYMVIISQANKEWLENIRSLIKDEFGLSSCISSFSSWDGFGLQVSGKKFYDFLVRECGQYSHRKYFPNWIFDLSPEYREFFWEKLLEGDGTPDGRYGTTSYKLANQLGLLLALQGKKFTVSPGHKYNEKWNVCYHFRTELENNYGQGNKSISEVDYNGWVYDLEVADTHNFVCGLGNIVCHNTFVDYSIKDPMPFIQSNVVGTYRMLEEARRCKTLKRYLQVSTDEVYGAILDGKYKEDARANPTNPYSASKMGGDALVMAYHHTYNMDTIITRTENNYGPYQGREKVFPVFIRKALNDEPLPVYGDGHHRRQWLYVEDHCSAIVHLLEHGESGEVYHVAGEQELENIELAKSILKLVGKPEDLITFVPDWDIRPGHDRRYALDCEKIKVTGWQAKWSIAKGFKKAVDWYCNNTWWFM